jgi:hypothetical protein
MFNIENSKITLKFINCCNEFCEEIYIFKNAYCELNRYGITKVDECKVLYEEIYVNDDNTFQYNLSTHQEYEISIKFNEVEFEGISYESKKSLLRD